MAFPQSFSFVTTPAQRSLPLPSSISLFRTGPGLSSPPPPKVGLKLPCLHYRRPATVQVSPSIPCWSSPLILGLHSYSPVLQWEAAESGRHALHLVQQHRLSKPQAEESPDRGKCLLVQMVWALQTSKGSWCGQTWETWPGGRKGGVANETLAPLRSKILGFSLIWALSFQTGFLPVALAILEITI